MKHLYVTNSKISGNIEVQGAKNSVLPILAGSILNKGVSVIHNCPDLSDVNSAIDILKYLGCKIKREEKTVIVDATDIKNYSIPRELMIKMRSSVMFLGPILARTGKADLSLPGGCELGPRPIDLHISALEKMGCKFLEKGNKIKAKVRNLTSQDIHLSFPSVGATENIMMLASSVKGTTRIFNSAREPEIVDLQNFLQKMGVKISGAGGSVIEIEGGSYSTQIEHRVMADRIVASTYLTAGAMTKGEIEISKVDCLDFLAVTEVLKNAGADISCYDDKVYLKTNGKRLKSVKPIKTMPYPGFPTDSAAILMSAMSIAEGTTVFVENIFENRYRHVAELVSMGADIEIFGKACVVNGKKDLVSAKVKATDLRAGASLILAGLVAEGTTEISEICHIMRGYEEIEQSFRKLGATISIK